MEGDIERNDKERTVKLDEHTTLVFASQNDEEVIEEVVEMLLDSYDKRKRKATEQNQ